MSERNKLDKALQRAARAVCGLPPDAEESLNISIAAAAINDALTSLAADGWELHGPINQHHVADAFWKRWRDIGETHKRGYYEATWGAIRAALRAAAAPKPGETT